MWTVNYSQKTSALSRNLSIKARKPTFVVRKVCQKTNISSNASSGITECKHASCNNYFLNINSRVMHTQDFHSVHHHHHYLHHDGIMRSRHKIKGQESLSCQSENKSYKSRTDPSLTFTFSSLSDHMFLLHSCWSLMRSQDSDLYSYMCIQGPFCHVKVKIKAKAVKIASYFCFLDSLSWHVCITQMLKPHEVTRLVFI